MRRILAALLFLMPAFHAAAQGDGNLVSVIVIDDGAVGGGNMVDFWLKRYVTRRVEEARRKQASAIVFMINTGGGQLDAALELTDLMVGIQIPTAAFIENKAYSAGALLALSCDKIFMKPTSVIGSALPIMMTGKGVGAAGEKFVRAVDKKFMAVASQKGHNAAMARAMVDPDFEVVQASLDGERRIMLREEFDRYFEENRNIIEVGPPICKRGEILDLTARQATEYGLAEGVVSELNEVLSAMGYAGAELDKREPSWAEDFARFLAGPVVSSALILLAILGISTELKTPGLGLGGAVFLMAISLFFWSKFVAGSADSVDIVLFFAGFVLLTLELLVIPGFGVAGISGLVLMGLSLLLTYIPDTFWDFEFTSKPWRADALTQAAGSLMVAGVAGFIAALVIISRAGSIPLLKKFVLGTESTAALAETPIYGFTGKREELVGKEGTALSTLRPSGRAEIAGKPMDVVTDGEYVEKGMRVRVVEVRSTRIVVESVQS